MVCSFAARVFSLPRLVYHLRMVFALAMAAIVNVTVVTTLQRRFVLDPCKTDGEREYARRLIDLTNPFVLCGLGALGHIRPHFTTTLAAVHCTVTCVASVLGACAFYNYAMLALLLTWLLAYFIGAGLMAEVLTNSDWWGFYRRVCVGWTKFMLVDRSDHAASMDCCICWGPLEPAAMLHNCAHVLCVDCADGLASCPKCRAPVTGFRRVFL